MNKMVIVGIIIVVAVSVGIISTVGFEDQDSSTIESQEEVTAKNTGKNLKIELREGIGVEGNP